MGVEGPPVRACICCSTSWRFFFLGLDIDFPVEELSGEADVLALFADGQRKLGVVDDDFDLLVVEVGDGDAGDLGGLEGFFGEGGDFFGVLDDVNFLAAELTDDGPGRACPSCRRTRRRGRRLCHGT